MRTTDSTTMAEEASSGLLNGVKTKKIPRKSAPKVKTGCITWIRHVKCDETKPICMRCSSTGRVCDGYDTTRKQPRKQNPNASRSKPEEPERDTKSIIVGARRTPLSLQIVPNPLLDFKGTPIEQRALNFFFHNTAPSLAGLFDATFWTQLLPRVAATERSVQHAAIAVAALHEQQQFGAPVDESALDLPIVQYNKAISELQRRLAKDGGGDEVTLLTCLLFVCLEFMRGAAPKALEHLQSGLNILVSSRARHGLLPKDPNKSPSVSNKQEDSFDEEVLQTFSRLSVQSSLVGRPPPAPLYDTINSTVYGPSDCIPFGSFREARNGLIALIMQSLQPTELAFKDKPLSSISAEDISARHATIVSQIQTWTARLGLSMTELLQNPSKEDMRGIRLLRIQSIVALIWNSSMVHSERGEMAFDEHISRFRSIIPLALSIIEDQDNTAQTSSGSRSPITTSSSLGLPMSTQVADEEARGISLDSSTFSLEMGIVFALHFVCAKCRCPNTRREALALLPRVRPLREGIWDARILAAISKYMIEFEEKDGNDSDTTPRGSDADEKREWTGEGFTIPYKEGETTIIGLGEYQEEKRWPIDERRITIMHILDGHDKEKRLQDVQFTWKPHGDAGPAEEFTVVIKY